MIKVGLCLLTWNELDGCRHDVPLINRNAFQQVYCVDGGSTDGTVEYLRENEIEVYAQSAPGYNQAIKDAVDYCDCDYCIIFHPKGSIPVTDTEKFRDFFEQGYDIVVASRMLKESINEEDERLFRPRKWFVLGSGFVAKVLFKHEGNTVLDVLHGFRGFKVDSFRAMNISDMSPSADLEMVCRSYKQRLKRIEFPTTEMPRMGGETHFKAISTGLKLLRYLIWETLRKESKMV